MYQLLQTQLSACSIVSVGHRPSLEGYHEHQLDLTQYNIEAKRAENIGVTGHI